VRDFPTEEETPAWISARVGGAFKVNNNGKNKIKK